MTHTKYYMLYCSEWDAHPTFDDIEEAEEALEYNFIQSLMRGDDEDFKIMELKYEG